ncbi:PolC-type DNA polymerase III [Frisingicoccus sp.]|uniref:3'-5' exonuclease n=1 Tax=Frisingicoccus sp. TaxID=1918627 RepID=UPI002EB8E3A6|nr:3'-5' exonuclease [Frisingicoccus sp.]
MMTSYVCFDLETTGLSPDRDEIIEIGAVKVDEGKVVDRFMCFVKPDTPISSMVTSITGITNEMTADAGPTDRIIYDFVEFCEDYPVVGHNLMFDYRFMSRYAKKYYMTFERSGVDTLKVARKVLPDLPSKSLESLCAYYGIVNPSAHRAYHDALATARLYQTLKHYYGATNEALFQAEHLHWKQKKIQPATNRQKQYLNELAKYHKISINSDFETLTRSEASRLIDRIILQHGQMARTAGRKRY